jgi:acetylornithine deacetylase/succinyl-diaminopimelate desuccinylase-like protein
MDARTFQADYIVLGEKVLEDLRKRLGTRLLEEGLRRFGSLGAVAEVTGVNRHNLSAAKHGRRNLPTAAIRKLAVALDALEE